MKHYHKQPLAYKKYVYSHSFSNPIKSYANAQMRYPESAGHRMRLRLQYWNNRLGLRTWAHKQLHKRKRYASPIRWVEMGLNDTRTKK